MGAVEGKTWVFSSLRCSLFSLVSLVTCLVRLAALALKEYTWIVHQMDIGTTLAFLLSRSVFKSETSFGFPSQNYTGESA